MRLIIAGSRHYAPERADELVAEAMTHVLVKIQKPIRVLCGCADGIDDAGQRWAHANSIPVEYHPADWTHHGRAAGPLRNRQMARAADALVLIWDGQSRGSASMLREARAAKLRVFNVKVTP